jgi:hypothetical protein
MHERRRSESGDRTDPLIKLIEHWKKRVIALLTLISLGLIAVMVVLLEVSNCSRHAIITRQNSNRKRFTDQSAVSRSPLAVWNHGTFGMDLVKIAAGATGGRAVVEIIGFRREQAQAVLSDLLVDH